MFSVSNYIYMCVSMHIQSQISPLRQTFHRGDVFPFTAKNKEVCRITDLGVRVLGVQESSVRVCVCAGVYVHACMCTCLVVHRQSLSLVTQWQEEQMRLEPSCVGVHVVVQRVLSLLSATSRHGGQENPQSPGVHSTVCRDWEERHSYHQHVYRRHGQGCRQYQQCTGEEDAVWRCCGADTRKISWEWDWCLSFGDILYRQVNVRVKL